MLPLFGRRKTIAKTFTRRELLKVGGLSLLGLSLDGFLRLSAAQSAAPASSNRFGQAKACILIHLFGAHPQHETFDPKPDAPAEVQGELKAIATSVQGTSIGEGLPQVAQVADRLTIVRSLTHALPFHGVHYSISGIPTISPTVEADPNDRQLWPSIGSVVEYLDDRSGGNKTVPIPRNIGLPFVLYSKANFHPIGGPYGGFLGSRYDPVWTEFSAKGTKPVPNPTAKPDLYDPFGGIEPTDRFDLAGPAGLPEGVDAARQGLRRTLLAQFDATRRSLDADPKVTTYDRYQSVAWQLLTSSRMGEALDVARESAAVRERYGMTLFGQAALAARRLIEAGGRFVTLFWDAYGDATAGWDTHFHHYPRLKQFLLPGFDQTFSALVLDLEDRGLLDETLIICTSEHGRTPRLTDRPGGGREHWSRAYSSVLAGGGTARGSVVGRTDSIAGDVERTPMSPKDILATAFHLLGIDPHTTILDPLGRPVPVAGEGRMRTELIEGEA